MKVEDEVWLAGSSEDGADEPRFNCLCFRKKENTT